MIMLIRRNSVWTFPEIISSIFSFLRELSEGICARAWKSVSVVSTEHKRGERVEILSAACRSLWKRTHNEMEIKNKNSCMFTFGTAQFSAMCCQGRAKKFIPLQLSTHRTLCSIHSCWSLPRRSLEAAAVHYLFPCRCPQSYFCSWCLVDSWWNF